MEKIKPYDKLKSILIDKSIVTDKAEKNLNRFFEDEKNYSPIGIPYIKFHSFFGTIILFLKKIDSFIFKNPSKISNNPHRRKK